MPNRSKYIFFGSSRLSVIVLETLKNRDFLPMAIVCPKDEKSGRGLELKKSQIKELAESLNIKVLQPDNLDTNFLNELLELKPDFILVASYGKILPKSFLEIGKGAINIHPSLLPKYRGPSPMQYQILNNDIDAGVSIMKMDDLMDHGPIIASKKISIPNWPISYLELEDILAKTGADLFSENIDNYLNGKTELIIQDEKKVTFTKLFKKEDGLIDLDNSSLENYLKYLALKDTLGVFTFVDHSDKKMRVKIKEAIFDNSKFIPTKVIPEGKKEVSYKDFLNGLK